MVRLLLNWFWSIASVLLRPRRPRRVRMKLYTSFWIAHWRKSWKVGDLLKGQLVLPVAQLGVTSRELEFKVGEQVYSVVLPPESVSSEKFDVLNGDLVEGALVDVNQFGKSLPRSFLIEVVFPVDESVPDQPGPVTLELSAE